MDVTKTGAILAGEFLLKTVVFDSDSSSDDELEEKRKPSRVENFMDRTVPGFTNKEFQSHFRITRECFNVLSGCLGPHLKKLEGSVGKSRIPVERQILAAVWLLATPDSYRQDEYERSVGLQFDMGKSSLFACFTRFTKALNIIAPQVISWPTRNQRQEIKNGFMRLSGMRGVIGAIDGTYVKIKAPQENPEVYINRKCFHGITLQAICTNSLSFSEAYTGYPSSVSDVRIFRNSHIYEAFLNNNEIYFDNDEYIIGDKAYPLFRWCIPPYIDRGRLQNIHRVFNIAHARTRQVIERSFALLFGRFRILRDLDMNRLDMIPATIIACCVLHNLCLMSGDELVELYILEGQPYVLNDGNVIEDVLVENVRNVQNLGVARRDDLAAQIYQRQQGNNQNV